MHTSINWPALNPTHEPSEIRTKKSRNSAEHQASCCGDHRQVPLGRAFAQATERRQEYRPKPEEQRGRGAGRRYVGPADVERGAGALRHAAREGPRHGSADRPGGERVTHDQTPVACDEQRVDGHRRAVDEGEARAQEWIHRGRESQCESGGKDRRQ